MNKKRLLITECLKNWYAIDSILLNGHAKNVIKEGKTYKEYLSLKAAILSNLYEYYDHINYSPKENAAFKNSREIQLSAVTESKKSKAITSMMMQGSAFKKDIKSYIVKESKNKKVGNLKKFSEKVIRERFNRMCLDNILIGQPLLESNCPQKTNDFKGEILEESYRILRTSLIRLVKNSVMNEAMLSKIVSRAVRPAKRFVKALGKEAKGVKKIIIPPGSKAEAWLVHISDPAKWLYRFVNSWPVKATVGFMYGVRLIKNSLNRCARNCGILKINTIKKQICMRRCEMNHLQKLIDLYTKEMEQRTDENEKMILANSIDKMRMELDRIQKAITAYETAYPAKALTGAAQPSKHVRLV